MTDMSIDLDHVSADAVMTLVRQLVNVAERQAQEIIDLTERWEQLSASVEALTRVLRSVPRTSIEFDSPARG